MESRTNSPITVFDSGEICEVHSEISLEHQLAYYPKVDIELGHTVKNVMGR